MPKLFENNRTYVLGDTELEIIGDREKLAQWRHKSEDLNAWAEAHRVDPSNTESR